MRVENEGNVLPLSQWPIIIHIEEVESERPHRNGLRLVHVTCGIPHVWILLVANRHYKGSDMYIVAVMNSLPWHM